MTVTWDVSKKGDLVELSNGNLTSNVPSNTQTVLANSGRNNGKWYWEITISEMFGLFIGVGTNNLDLNANNVVSTFTRVYRDNATKYPENTTYGTSFVVGDTIGVALDMDIGTLTFYKNGVSQGVSHTDVKSLGTVYPLIIGVGTNKRNVSTVNFGASNFKYTIPTGYKAYSTLLNKFLILSSDRKVISHENDGVNGIVKYIPNNSEQNFINHGLDKSAQIDLNAPMTNKVLIEQSSTPLGEGKVFKKSIDISQMVIKKVEVK